jgi:protein-S-isoprenylcysteine O-methyltransferase Ste14
VDGLAGRTLLGFAQLVAFMAAALFGPAWTFDYWQGWAYVGVFAGSSALITAYLWKHDRQLLERRVKAGPVAENQRRQQLIQVCASLAFIGILVLPSLDRRFAWSHVPAAVAVAGDVLVALGFFAVFLVFKENTFTAATIEVAADQRVIETGPYRIVRHPMYAGALVMLFGTPFALGSWWGEAFFIALALVIVWRLLDEEKFLSKNLPGYERYCAKVRYRLIPFVF